eukprot:4313029-Pyramimonas_sp.AAC.1
MNLTAACVVQYVRDTKAQNASYQRCAHPGFPGASSVCNVLVPWTGVRRGARKCLSVKTSTRVGKDSTRAA